MLIKPSLSLVCILTLCFVLFFGKLLRCVVVDSGQSLLASVCPSCSSFCSDEHQHVVLTVQRLESDLSGTWLILAGCGTQRDSGQSNIYVNH